MGAYLVAILLLLLLRLPDVEPGTEIPQSEAGGGTAVV
jgi:hypothetical protein